MDSCGELFEAAHKTVFVDSQLPGRSLAFFGDIAVAAYDQANATLRKRDHPVDKLWGDRALRRGESFPGGCSDESVFEGEAVDGGWGEEEVCGSHSVMR